MKTRKNIGVRVDDYRTDVRTGLRLAADHAFAAVELSADGGEVAPDNLTESGRRHLARLVANGGLTLAALATDRASAGLADPARVDGCVAASARTLQLAADMHVPVVSADVGELLDLPADRREQTSAALRALADTAERVGTVYAIRSRLADPRELAELVRALDCPLIRVSLDPGALLMAGFDPAEAILAHGDQLVLAYVRDAVRGSATRAGREVALGDGGLDLLAYLASVQASGCRSTPILRRAEAVDPAAALAADKSRLESELLH